MVALTAPVVVAPAALLVAAFVAAWYYRFGGRPPVRAVLVVALGCVFVAYSLASVAELVANPVESLVVVVAALVLLALSRVAVRRGRG